MIPLTILIKMQREHLLDRQDVTKKKKKPFMGTTLGALSRSFNDPVVTVFGIRKAVVHIHNGILLSY